MRNTSFAVTTRAGFSPQRGVWVRIFGFARLRDDHLGAAHGMSKGFDSSYLSSRIYDVIEGEFPSDAVAPMELWNVGMLDDVAEVNHVPARGSATRLLIATKGSVNLCPLACVKNQGFRPTKAS
jgi:hypothetical protein